jgi:hypothetical protein
MGVVRVISGGVILFPPDVEGIIGAAALVRRLGPEYDLLAVSPHETTRRLYGLSGEPVPRQVHVVDVVPTDSLDSLLVPALHRFVAAGSPVTWVYGRSEPPDLLRGLGDLIRLQTADGREAWRIVAEAAGDRPFLAFADPISRGNGPGTDWRMLLSAVASSFDWRRVYSAVTGLARLLATEESEGAWAVEQLEAVERARACVRNAPVQECRDLHVAVCEDPGFTATVRPEAVHGVRTDVDAVAFVAGPGRLRVVATHPGADLSVLDDVPGLVDQLQDGSGISGSITAPRAEFSWQPDGDVPTPICALLDLDLFRSARPPAAARIERPLSERRAKGIDRSRLAPADVDVIREALGGQPAAPPEGDLTAVREGVRSPAHRTSVELGVVPTAR